MCLIFRLSGHIGHTFLISKKSFKYVSSLKRTSKPVPGPPASVIIAVIGNVGCIGIAVVFKPRTYSDKTSGFKTLQRLDVL